MSIRLRSWLTGIVPLAFILLVGVHAAVAQTDEVTAEVQAVVNPAPTPLVFPECRDTLTPYTICEIVITQTAYANDLAGETQAYTQPDITAEFVNGRDPDLNKTVRAFYDKKNGQIVFKVRFNVGGPPPLNVTDNWNYTLRCNPQAGGSCPSSGTIALGTGSFMVQNPPPGPAMENGFLRRDAARNYRLVYDSGYHPFIWGQTYYSIVNNVLDQEKGGSWKTAVDNSVQNGLNKVRMLMFPFPIVQAEQKYRQSLPFKDAAHDQLNVEHWTGFDAVVNRLYQKKDTRGNRALAEIILFTDSTTISFSQIGNPPQGDTARDDRYVKYAAARYGAFPNVMWCLANEWHFARVPGTNPDDDNDSSGLKAAYFNARAETLLDSDPWAGDIKAPGRALTIHPKNVPVFKFFNKEWPSHAVLQWSIGHDDCINPGLKINSKCKFSDEWANFSIINNWNLPGSSPNPKKIAVFNDEYGYLGAKLKVNPYAPDLNPTRTEPCPNGVFTNEFQRRGMWAIAVAGGNGSFGDSTGLCTGVKTGFTTTITGDWAPQTAYNEIRYMADYFNGVLPNWWVMNPNLKLTAPTNSMRAYALEQTGTAATKNRGTYLFYAVPTGMTGSIAKGQFKVRNLAKGNYITAYFNPRAGGAETKRTAKIIKPNTTYQFPAKPYDDWVFRIYPDPLKSEVLSVADEYEIVWVGDSLPEGAVPSGHYEGWNWTDSDPTPISDSYAHQSALVPNDVHQHYFTGATETLTVNAGDGLFAYVYLDPSNPPSQVMLQWNDGTWEHRAYWGANLLPWGTDGTSSRRYMGPLPATDQWVRLEVPASAVGLEGRTLNGMAFTLYGGMATWDDAGKTGQGVQSANLASGKPTTQSSTANGSSAQLAVDGKTNGNYFGGSVTHTGLDAQAWWQVDLGGKNWLDQVKVWTRTDCCSDRLSDFYVFVSDEPFASTDTTETQEQPGVSTYYLAGQAGSPSVIDVGRSGRYVRVQLAGANYLSLAEVEVFGKPASTTTSPAPTLSISDKSIMEGNAGSVGAVFNVSLSAASASTVAVNYSTGDGTAVAYNDYTPVSGTLIFSPGQTTKTVSVPVNGDTAVESNETFFVNLSNPSNASITDEQGLGTILNDDSATTPPPTDVVWVEDSLPAGASPGQDNDGWSWISSNPSPISGSLSHQSNVYGGLHQHQFLWATNTFAVNAGDTLIAYVYLDPANLPSEVMLQWCSNQEGWNHRAYWGANQLPWGTDGTGSRRLMGALPAAGQWVRLEVPAAQVGLEGKTLHGMAFSLYGGRAAWDHAGKSPANAGLVGYWKFDEGVGMTAADSSGGGHHGALQNGTLWAQGKWGAALSFDGVDDMVATNGLSDVTNNFTLAFWALPTATHEIDPESTGNISGTSGQRYAFWPVWYDAGHAGAGVSVGTNGVSVYEHAAGSMPAPLVYQAALNNWTHIAVVYENKQPKLYVNGVLVRTGLTSLKNFVHLNPSYMGGQSYGYYAGRLDDVRAYSRALTPGEVSALFNTVPPPSPSASVAWVQPAEVSWGTPNTLTAAGYAQNGSGGVQLVWRDETAGTGWNTVAYQATPGSDGTWSHTIPTSNKCHTYRVYVNYSGIRSPDFVYNGLNSGYCTETASVIWIQPQSTAGFGPPGSLVVAGSAKNAPSGTQVFLSYRDVTAGTAWNQLGYAPIPDAGDIWYNAIEGANPFHVYQVRVTYDAVTPALCTYQGANSISWCQ